MGSNFNSQFGPSDFYRRQPGDPVMDAQEQLETREFLEGLKPGTLTGRKEEEDE